MGAWASYQTEAPMAEVLYNYTVDKHMKAIEYRYLPDNLGTSKT